MRCQVESGLLGAPTWQFTALARAYGSLLRAYEARRARRASRLPRTRAMTQLPYGRGSVGELWRGRGPGLSGLHEPHAMVVPLGPRLSRFQLQEGVARLSSRA